MGIRRGSISTPIIADGLIYNFDPANRASYIPNATTTYNTANSTSSGSLENDPDFLTPPTSASCWQFDGIDDYISTPQTSTGYQNITVNIWMKTMLFNPPVAYNSGSGLFTNTATNNDGNFGIYDGGYEATRKLYIKAMCGGTRQGKQVGSGGIQVNDDNWHYLSYAYKATGPYNDFSTPFDLDLYTDAENQYSVTAATVGYWRRWVVIEDIAKPGAGFNSAREPYFPGEIGAVHIYNRKLSQLEVLHNYNALKGRFS